MLGKHFEYIIHKPTNTVHAMSTWLETRCNIIFYFSEYYCGEYDDIYERCDYDDLPDDAIRCEKCKQTFDNVIQEIDEFKYHKGEK